jgi:DNA-binding MarR family transcriptional regulator
MSSVSTVNDSPNLGAAARRFLKARRWRDELLGADLFSDPAWDILLDLFASEAEGRNVSVSSACVAACVPATTAIRWISRLETLGLIERHSDPDDQRRSNLRLSAKAKQAVSAWLTKMAA